MKRQNSLWGVVARHLRNQDEISVDCLPWQMYLVANRANPKSGVNKARRIELARSEETVRSRSQKQEHLVQPTGWLIERWHRRPRNLNTVAPKLASSIGRTDRQAERESMAAKHKSVLSLQRTQIPQKKQSLREDPPKNGYQSKRKKPGNPAR